MGPETSSVQGGGPASAASSVKPKPTFRQKLQGGDTWKGSNLQKSLQDSGKSMQEQGQRMTEDARMEAASRIGPVQYKRGGKIRKPKSRSRAVPIIAHENERVISAGKRKKVERLMKRAGMKLTDKTKRKKDRKDSSR